MSIFEFDEEKEWRLFGEAEREAGRKEERKDLMVSLIKDGIISITEATKRLSMTEEELKKYI